MNRYELLLLVIIAAVAIVMLIKSKRFDNFIKSLLRGSNPTTASEIKQDAEQVTNSINARNKELERIQNNLHKEKKILKNL